MKNSTEKRHLSKRLENPVRIPPEIPQNFDEAEEGGSDFPLPITAETPFDPCLKNLDHEEGERRN